MKKRKPGRPKTGHDKAKSYRLTPLDLQRIEIIRKDLSKLWEQNVKPVVAVRYALKTTAEGIAH